MSVVADDAWEFCVEDLTGRIDVWVGIVRVEVIAGTALEDEGSCV